MAELRSAFRHRPAVVLGDDDTALTRRLWLRRDLHTTLAYARLCSAWTAVREESRASAIGVCWRMGDGNVLEEIGRTIGTTTTTSPSITPFSPGSNEPSPWGGGVDRVLRLGVAGEADPRPVPGQERRLKPLYEEALIRLQRFPRVRIEHVKRDKNAAADRWSTSTGRSLRGLRADGLHRREGSL